MCIAYVRTHSDTNVKRASGRLLLFASSHSNQICLQAPSIHSCIQQLKFEYKQFSHCINIFFVFYFVFFIVETFF